MQVIKCELCGSNEFKKINGEYECQYCHTKYTVEEAKKLMIEGVVEVKGTVNIDSSNQKTNYEKLAQRSFNDQLYDQAYEYYNKLLEIDSDNWKYIYKKGLCAAWQSTLVNFRIDETIKACKNAFNVMEMNKIQIDNKEEICFQMAGDINKVAVAFCKLAQNHYTKFWSLETTVPEYWNQLQKLIACQEYAANLIKGNIDKNARDKDLYITILKNIIVYYVEICKKRKYKSGVNQNGDVFSWIWYKNELRTPILQKYDKYTAELKMLVPTYAPPVIERRGKGGCYVATSVYGSYDTPEVWTLRRFRDYKLNKTWNGKLFIKLYYLVSPTIVKWYGNTKWFNRIFKKKLDKMVIKLKKEGYESTPYKDLY